MSPFWRPPLYASINNGYCGCIVVVNNERKYLPLTQVSAHATLLASTSRTTLTQTFKNPTSEAIKESRYVFPIFDGVSVVAFTCTIGKTVIKGVVKSKPEAKKEFDAAVAKGQQAGLLEQSERASDVFTTALGNVGPKEEAKVEITYLGELKHDAEVDGLRYTMPTNIAPRYADDLVLPIPVNQSAVLTEDASLSVTIDVDLATGAAIKSVQSPSHPISVNIGTTSARPNDDPSLQYASASLTRSDVKLDKDFIVQVCAKGLGDPSAVVETHATIPSRRAIMATLVPRFNLTVEKPEVVFICDRSGSMDSGTRLPNLIASLQVFLKSLPVGVLFNICSFGSSHSFLWPKSQPYNQTTLDEATAHVKGFSANYGGTRIREPIEATFNTRERSRNLEVFLMTDGETWDESSTFEVINRAVKEAQGAIRLFALGVGADASHSLIEGAARAGRGFAQSVGENEKMNKKVVRMLKGALTPHVNDYTLEIKYEKEDGDEFELVEKVSEWTVVDNGQEAEAEKPVQASISLHDTSVKDEDLEMPDAKALPLPVLPTPTYLQAPHIIPPLFPFNRTSVYVLLSEARAHRRLKSIVLRGMALQSPLELEIPITAIAKKGTTIHQLAARKAVQDLEEGRGWIYDAKLRSGKMLSETYAMRMSDVARDAGINLGIDYQVAGKWCSFVAVKRTSDRTTHEASSDSVKAATRGGSVASVIAGAERDAAPTESCDAASDEEDLGFVLMSDGDDNCEMNRASLDTLGGIPRYRASLDAPGSALRKRAMPAMPAMPAMRLARAAPRRSMPAPPPPPPPAPIQASAATASFGGPGAHGFGATSSGQFGTAQPATRVLDGTSSQQQLATGFHESISPSLFGAPAPSMNAASGGLFGSPQSPTRSLSAMSSSIRQQQQQQQQQQMSQQMSKPRELTSQQFLIPQQAFGGNHLTAGNPCSNDALELALDNDNDDKAPLEAIIAQQAFSGSWTWSAALERLLGVTQEAVDKALHIAAEATATLCAIAYLQAKLADDEEVWELVVEKARGWLAATLSLDEDDVKGLEARARQVLG